MDTVVDNLEIVNERLAWIQAAEDIKKPVYLRTELEMSRILTLISRLSFFHHLTFPERFSLTKVVRFKKIPAGVVLLETTGPPEALIDENDNENSFSASAPRGVPPVADVNANPLVSFAPMTSAQTHAVRTAELQVVIFGCVMLRVSQPQGISQTIVDKGEPIGTSIIMNALPAGSQYVTTEPTELLSFNTGDVEEVLQKLELLELRHRMAFFQNLTVPILATWSEHQFEQLSRCVFPIRVLSRELVVREGTEASAAYFISSGKLKVVREIDFSHTTNTPSMKLLELATLAEGEFFGELALLRHQVDSTKKIKLSKLTTEITFGAKKDPKKTSAPPPPPPFGGVQSLGGMSASVRPPVPYLRSAADEAESSSDSEDEDFKTLRASKASLRRQATVYAHTPGTLYVLPREQFIKVMTGPALVRLREYAKGYPSQQEIRAHFSKQQKWEEFKNQLVAQVRSSTHGAKRGK
jgi:CRP-like cAMP-binding protein